MDKFRNRLTYANVMSSIAVFLLLGGGAAFAAGHLGKNTVGSKQLKKNAVLTAKIKKEAVTTAKLKKDAVNGAKVKDGSLSGADINLSTLGTVPSAETANSLKGFNTFTGRGSEDTVTTLFSTGQFDVVGICDENNDFDPPWVPVRKHRQRRRHRQSRGKRRLRRFE